MEQQLFDLQVDSASQAYLSETAKWARFLAIVGFICCGLLLIVGIFFIVALSALPGDAYGPYTSAIRPVIGFMYVVFSGVYLFPCIYLNNYSSRMKGALASNDQDSLTRGFSSLKTFFKFWGIVTIIGLALGVLSIIGGLVAGIFLASSVH